MDHKTIGQYEVVRLIGEGGMGRVYLARDPMLDRHVAVKVLSSSAPLGEGLRASNARRPLRSIIRTSSPSTNSAASARRTCRWNLDGRNLRDVIAEDRWRSGR
jgi:serine/threonine-protein kinase